MNLPRTLPGALCGLLVACAPESGSSSRATSTTSEHRSAEDPPILFRFPVAERDLIVDRVMGVDHDPTVYEGVDRAICTNYAGEGFPYCYDEHPGSDFDLAGGFDTMDAGSATVVAAGPGEVIEVVDGNYDRCHLDTDTWGADCDGHPKRANLVALRHTGGFITWYAHFMANSITVAVGDMVDRGDPLGLVGSSGNSTGPHLHFELNDADENVIDPFAGPHSQDESWWCEQDGSGDLPGSGC